MIEAGLRVRGVPDARADIRNVYLAMQAVALEQQEAALAARDDET